MFTLRKAAISPMVQICYRDLLQKISPMVDICLIFSTKCQRLINVTTRKSISRWKMWGLRIWVSGFLDQRQSLESQENVTGMSAEGHLHMDMLTISKHCYAGDIRKVKMILCGSESVGYFLIFWADIFSNVHKRKGCQQLSAFLSRFISKKLLSV